MLTGTSMIGLIVLLPLLSLAEHLESPRVEEQQRSTRDVDFKIDSVQLTGSRGMQYGILEVLVQNQWTRVCEDQFNEKAAKVFCRQLNFKDGVYQPGWTLGKQPNNTAIKQFNFSCFGVENNINLCLNKNVTPCLTKKYVTLYCSNSDIEKKDRIEVRIKGTGNKAQPKFGRLEVNKYGFWSPVCYKDWTDVEADAACQYLKFAGGVASYASSPAGDSTPIALGGFNCSDESISFIDCPHKGFGEDLGCDNPIDPNNPRRVAGVHCFAVKEQAIEFRLSDRWYGRVEVKYDNEWGRVCNRNWDDKDASVICKSLGYKDGQVERSRQIKEGSGFIRMDNVDCKGDENSLLECGHEGNWVPGPSTCEDDAVVTCNITICGSLDIRNTVHHLNLLEHCSIIEGNLTILLINTVGQEDYDQYSFPNLVEITEYLVLFRAEGLKSLRNLFPNLAVIRGDKLFNDYALVAFEMPDMVELGLPSLVSIPRGAVRLDKNPNLCYIETIDWSRITTGVRMEDNYFNHNKEVQECVNRCDESCPSIVENGKELQRCWTIHRDHCQKMLSCPKTCTSGVCNGDICCDRNCIGGCTGTDASQCTACKQVMVRDSNKVPRCAQRCSAGTYEYRKHRCLYDHECLNFTDYATNKCMFDQDRRNCLKLVVPENINKDPGFCAEDCPAGYNVDAEDQQKCETCKGRCPKVCEGKHIDSVTSAQDLNNCNIINGPLTINLLRGSQVGQELERSMAQVEEITGYLKITHSYSLLSLHFLKGLRKIGGETLYKDKYVLYIYDNMNIQELFTDEVMSNLTVAKGELHFQYNRKLCFNKISEFANTIGIAIDSEASEANNGDDIACDIQILKFDVFQSTPHIAFISYIKINMSGDQRQLIGYSINWKESEVKNASIYRGRDACSDDVWQTREICTENEPRCDKYAYITGLSPWTQYAVYMQAITVSKAMQGGISELKYFRTKAEVPTSPMNLKVIAEHSGELKVTWDPPNKPRGNVTHYILYWRLRELDPSVYELRDYCQDPLTNSIAQREEERKQKAESEKNNHNNGTCCECPKTEKEKKVEERERNLDIRFQDYLQNAVYVKRVIEYPNASNDQQNTLEPAASTIGSNKTKSLKKLRTTRAAARPDPASHEVAKYTYEDANGNPIINMTTVTAETTTTPPVMVTTSVTETTSTPAATVTTPVTEAVYYSADVYERFFIITELGHFQDYNIEVIACQDRLAQNDKLKCSQKALGFGRTMPDKYADTINASSISIQPVKNRTGAVYIKWDDPPHPNGLIVTYDIEYRKTAIQNVKANVVCITYKEYRDEGNRGYTVDKLDSGNHTFRIRATSLAGNGSWTMPLTFNIPDPERGEWSSVTIIVVVGICLAIIVAITIAAVWFVAKRRFEKEHKMRVSENSDYHQCGPYPVYEPDEWEVDRENVKLLRELGQGSFGMVYEGMVNGLVPGCDQVRVAVKTTNNNSTDHDRYQFLQEASIMKAFHCHHVVKLIGVVSKQQPAYVLMELMPQGDLKNFLRMHRPDEDDNEGRTPPTLRQILQMAGEIADGMAYLADKKYVHRDLAARNCMVGENLIVKIGDFGMTRDIYETDYYRKGSRGLLPVRWMAPESLRDGVFTSSTDVWSYGVVLWEMATLAAQPYQGLSNEEVLRYVNSGKVMDTPERCPTKLYDLMLKCWRYKPLNRPTFKEIIELLLPDLDQDFHDCSYFFSEENARYEEARAGATVNAVDNNPHTEGEGDDEDDPHCPMNDYVDEAQLPMLGSCLGASNGHSVELQDIFSDNGTYPHYSSSHNRLHEGSAEVCDCTNFRDVDEGAAAQSVLFNRRSICNSPANSAIGGSSDGSKESSKSSSSSYAHMNGLSVANGHVPLHMRTTPC